MKATVDEILYRMKMNKDFGSGFAYYVNLTSTKDYPHTTLERLVREGLLQKEQSTPYITKYTIAD